MKLRLAKSPGFTLIELVICSLIVFILAGAPTLMIVRIQNQQDLLQRRMEVAFEAGEALRVWREDVQHATAVQVNQDGNRMDIRTAAAGGEAWIVYEARDSMLIRIASDSADSPRKLAGHIEQLSFQNREDAWQMSWVAVYDDGARRIRWRREGNAAPLIRPLLSGENSP